MKIAPRQIPSFINNPDKSLAAILIYGPNTGLVKDYIKKLTAHYLEDPNDPFNSSIFTGAGLSEDPAKFADEAASMSMLGGQRLVMIKEAIESNTLHIKTYCENPNPDCIIIIEGADLKPSSSLRKLAESHDNIACIACYLEEERNISGKIREIAQHAGYAIDTDATRLLSEALAGDTIMLQNEMQKIILYMGLHDDYAGFGGEPLRQKIGDITVQDVIACNPNMRDYTLDDLISMIALGQTSQAHRMAQKMLAEGIPPIAIFRSLLRHFRRLLISKERMAEGLNAQAAMGALKPPVFYKYKQDFQAQLHKWRTVILEKVIEKIVFDEAESKNGRLDPETLCLHLVVNISRTASALK